MGPRGRGGGGADRRRPPGLVAMRGVDAGEHPPARGAGTAEPVVADRRCPRPRLRRWRGAGGCCPRGPPPAPPWPARSGGGPRGARGGRGPGGAGGWHSPPCPPPGPPPPPPPPPP